MSQQRSYASYKEMSVGAAVRHTAPKIQLENGKING